MNVMAGSFGTALKNLSARIARSLGRDRSTLKTLRWGCLLLGWLVGIGVALSALPLVRQAVELGAGAPTIVDWGVAKWQMSVAGHIVLRLVLALSAAFLFLAIGEVFAWMLAVEEHLSVLRSRSETAREQ